MSLSEQVESLFKLGVAQINIGQTKDRDFVMEVRQIVDNGESGKTESIHLIVGPSVVQCLENAKSKVDHAVSVPVFLSRKN